MKKIYAAIFCFLIFGGCFVRQSSEPSVSISQIPPVDRGGTDQLETIRGDVYNSKPGYKIVLYARSGDWFVQPYVETPFTEIKPDSSWESVTHLGTEYAVLLVTGDFVPPLKTAILPEKGGAVVAEKIVKGSPTFWASWWFRGFLLLAAALLLLYFYHLKFQQLSRELNVRFEERLAERTRIARELHDSLLQGFVGVSMQINVAADQLPADSPAKPQLNHIIKTIEKAIDEGRNTVRGLRSSEENDFTNLAQRFSLLRQDLDGRGKIDFQFVEKGLPEKLCPAIADEVFSIIREASLNAFQHSSASRIAVEIEYNLKNFRFAVRDNGCGINSEILDAGREGHWGISGMRERAEKIGANIKISSRLNFGTEIELSLPNHIALEQTTKSRVFRRLYEFYPRLQPTKNPNVKKLK